MCIVSSSAMIETTCTHAKASNVEARMEKASAPPVLRTVTPDSSMIAEDPPSAIRRFSSSLSTITLVSPVMGDAPPPWHALALVVCCIAIFARTLPSSDEMDRAANVSVFSHRIYPAILSVQQLGYIRCLCSLFIIGVSIKAVFFDPGWIQQTAYLSQSKLQRGVLIPVTGLRTQLAFTSWAWNLLGLSFGLNGILSLLAAHNSSSAVLSPFIMRIALMLWEIAAPLALFVACIVRYALWPRLLQQHVDTSQMKSPLHLLWHNANVIMVMLEVSTWGGLPVYWTHVSLSALFGLAYVLFSWSMAPHWNFKEGPQFLYFFLDTTLGWTTTVALVLLLSILMLFYGLFAFLDYYLRNLNIFAVILVSSGVCRFRD